MPELPEVETLVRQLAGIVGKRIVDATLLDDRLPVASDALIGASIDRVERRGKYILLGLGERGVLVIHLRMSGRLRLDCCEDEMPYTRMILSLESGEAVYFINPRRLGTVMLRPVGFEPPLGIEPLDEGFTVELLGALVGRSRAPIKALLLNQTAIAGIGNIYAAEALWRAGVDPRRPAHALSAEEITALHAGITSVLREAIAQLGTSIGNRITDYRPSAERGGSFQNHLSVYGKQDRPCERCGTIIERVRQAGRTTCFCPTCQL